MVQDSEPRPPERTASPSQYDENGSLTKGLESPSFEPDKEDEHNGFAHPARPPPPRRQSSLAQSRPNGTPRTINRVRFDVDELHEETSANGSLGTRLLELDDPMDDRDDNGTQAGGGRAEQRLPLLTGVEAPSVRLAGDFDAVEHLEDARPKSGIKSAFMNMANSIIGAGIIGQPYAFRQAGLLTGAILLVGLTITVDWTIRLIVINSKLSGANSFQATVQKCFGKIGLIAVSVAQWAFAFGGMLAFCIIVGDTIPHVMIYLFPSIRTTTLLWLLTDRRAVILLFILGISFPLSLYRDIAMLAKASTLALISMLTIITTVITQGARVPPDRRGTINESLFINTGIFQAIGVISFAFVCHHNSLLIYGSLKRPTLDRFTLVTHYSTGISMVACLAMALSGFLTFGDKTVGNVLNNFPTDNLMVNIARICFGLNMLTTLPLECFVCREVLLTYFYPSAPHSTIRHVALTTAHVAAAVFFALLTCDLGAVFELIGATSACALAYILPPLCYIKLSKRSWRTGVAWAVVVFGSSVMFISLILAGRKILRGEEGHSCNIE